jgi:hypothetical protein
MFALAGAGAAVAKWHREHPHAKHFVFFADNQAAICNIEDTTDHPAQLASIIFMKHINTLLSSDNDTRVEIRWIPGQKGFTGNERADLIAKATVNDAPSHTPPSPGHTKRPSATH